MQEKNKQEKSNKAAMLNGLKKDKTINEKEIDILNFWNAENIFEKSLAINKNIGEKYTFYDGPPFATGMPHHGTVLQSCIKDAIPRYQTMRGKTVRRVWGWDCHGLPIETLIEKEIGLKSKQDIEVFGVANFNKAAADSVYRYETEWKKIVPRLGRWIDMENAYATINPTYTESVWWSFSELYKKGMAYEGHYIMHICPRCETPLAQSEVNQPGCYKDVTDISVYVPFELEQPLQASPREALPTYLLAWTTTPWTLPGNTAIAINRNLTYVKVEIDGKFYIVGKDRVTDVLKLKNLENSNIEEISGEDLIGLKYKPVFDYFNNSEYLKTLDTEKSKSENIYKVWHADFVTADTGTGIAHEAPAFGEEDYRLAQENKIPTILHVKMNGEFVKEVLDFQDMKVKKKDDTQTTDIEIIKWLAHNGKLFHKQKIVHSYPHCWRCDTPLLNYATTSWYVNIQKVKDKLVEKNKKVKWIPEHVRDGRFGKWLEGARDWAISRNRYWGAPIPVWKSEEEIFVPSSLKDLQSKTKAKNKYTFVRHGQAYSNLDQVINVKIENDKGLTENGFHQIEEIANNYKNENNKIDLIISSPYKRTRETAEIFAKKFNVKVEIDERVQEFQLEEMWEGRKWDDLYKESEHKYFQKIRGEKESRYEMGLRIASMIYELEEKYKDEKEGKNILIVSHSSPLQAINIYNSGNIYEKNSHGPEWKHFTNGEILQLDFKPLPHDETGAVNFHIPFIDNVKLYDSKGGEMKREAGVFDCWYESGSMPYAQLHFPFENKKLFEENFPADFISEGVDQTRGWFYSMFVLGIALFDQSPYKNVICTGLVMAGDGKKISKSLKNYTDPLLIVEKYGLDAMRYYLLSSPVVKGEATNFTDEGVGDVYKKNNSRLLNVLSFYNLYRKDNEVSTDNSSAHPMDLFILARLRQVRLQVEYGFENLQLDEACKPIDKFIDDLSVWYLRRSRERLKNGDKNAIETLQKVLFEFAKILASIMPFTAEIIYQEVKNTHDIESVHLTKWTEDIIKTLTKEENEVLEKMNLVRELVTLILDERTKAKIKVRQPLSGIMLRTVKYDLLKSDLSLQQEIKDETNIKFIKFVNPEEDMSEIEYRNMEIYLDTTITDELKQEGLYRELVRKIQDRRKEMNLVVSDRVKAVFENSMDNESREALGKFKSELEADCGVLEYSFGDAFEIVK